MPALLFETGPEPQRLERGEFQCPHCGGLHPYTRVNVRKAVTVMGLHVPVGSYGEYVECADCLCTYRPEVLAYDAGADRPRILAEYQRALRRVLALLVITDGRIDDAEVATVQRVFEAVCGETLTAAEVVEEARDVARSPTTVPRFLAQVIGYLNDYGKEQILRGAAMVCHADGSVHDREEDMVRRLGAVMRLPADRLEMVLRAFA